MRRKDNVFQWLLVLAVIVTGLMTSCGGASAGKSGAVPKSGELLAAIDNREFPVIVEILHKGADVNVKDENGLTPLHHAAALDDRKIIELLLDAGADPAATDANGNTPLELAKKDGLRTAINALR